MLFLSIIRTWPWIFILAVLMPYWNCFELGWEEIDVLYGPCKHHLLNSGEPDYVILAEPYHPSGGLGIETSFTRNLEDENTDEVWPWRQY